MMHSLRVWVGAALLLSGTFSLIAQEPKAAAPASTEYYPLKLKSKWVYKTNDQSVEIEAVSAEKGGFKLETKVNNKTVAAEVVEVTAEGVFRSSVKGDKIDPPLKFLALPVKKDAEWTVNSKVGMQTIKGKFTIKSENESVTVPAGKYDTVLVDGPELDIAGTKTAVKYYFAKNVGVVKLSYEIQGTSVVLELKEYVEGK
jgi:hypothetical protein